MKSTVIKKHIFQYVAVMLQQLYAHLVHTLSEVSVTASLHKPVGCCAMSLRCCTVYLYSQVSTGGLREGGRRGKSQNFPSRVPFHCELVPYCIQQMPFLRFSPLPSNTLSLLVLMNTLSKLIFVKNICWIKMTENVLNIFSPFFKHISTYLFCVQLFVLFS